MVHRVLGHTMRRGVDGLRQAVPRSRPGAALDEERRRRTGGVRRHAAGPDIRAHLRQLSVAPCDASPPRGTEPVVLGGDAHRRFGYVVPAVLDASRRPASVSVAGTETDAAAEPSAVADAYPDVDPTADGRTADCATTDL